MDNNGHKRQRPQKEVYWVCAIEKSSQRPIVQGYHLTEDAARQWGWEHIKDGDFEVCLFPTVNKIAARDYYKNRILERTNSLASIFTRAKYPK